VRVGLWQSCGSLNCIEEDVSSLRATGLLSVPATILLALSRRFRRQDIDTQHY
jgi:hypothetical protein